MMVRCGMVLSALSLLLVVCSASLQPGHRGHLVFFSIPLPGHVNPLLRQAEELYARGWHVSLLSAASVEKHVLSSSSNVAFLSAGDCSHSTELDFFERLSSSNDNRQSSILALQWTIDLWPCLFDGALNALDRVTRPTAMIIDALTPAGFDVADFHGIPWMVNNPTMLALLSPVVIPPADYTPFQFSTVSIYKQRASLMERSAGPVLRLISRVFIHFLFDKPLNAHRAARGVLPASPSLYWCLRGKLIMVTGSFALEYARPLPPLVQMVGPMIPAAAATAGAQASELLRLSSEEQAFLGGDLPVVYVSMGTIASLDAAQMKILKAGLSSSQFRVLWKAKLPQHNAIINDDPDFPSSSSFLSPSLTSSHFRVTSWVTSQMGVLAHKNVQLFVSHCGYNSVYEAAYFATPVLCIPLFADQYDLALRVADAGLGGRMDKTSLNATLITESVLRILTDPAFSSNSRRIQSAVRLDKGIVGAANLIEHFAEFGIDFWRENTYFYNDIQSYQLDVCGVWAFFAFMLHYIFVIRIGGTLARFFGCKFSPSIVVTEDQWDESGYERDGAESNPLFKRQRMSGPVHQDIRTGAQPKERGNWVKLSPKLTHDEKGGLSGVKLQGLIAERESEKPKRN